MMHKLRPLKAARKQVPEKIQEKAYLVAYSLQPPFIPGNGYFVFHKILIINYLTSAGYWQILKLVIVLDKQTFSKLDYQYCTDKHTPYGIVLITDCVSIL
jgi:hypothetical protein